MNRLIQHIHTISARFVILTFASFFLALSLGVQAQEGEPAPASAGEGSAFSARLAASSLVLDVIQAGNRYIAVGERGHVLLSEDGEQWRQAHSVPTRANLTALTFYDGQLWAVGHDAVIITSSDMGENWSLQYADPDAEQPFMDVVFINGQQGIAIGAYSLVATTDNGGVDWEASNMLDLVVADEVDAITGDGAVIESDDSLTDDEFLDEGIEYHLNAILHLGGENLLIAAEAGNGYRSEDGGVSWRRFGFPYSGSMFGLIAEQENCILAYGLRGHVQRSCDSGETWDELNTGVLASLFGATLYDGGVALVGANGTLIQARQGADSFQTIDLSSGEDLAAVFAVGDHLMTAGEDGLSRVGGTDSGEEE